MRSPRAELRAQSARHTTDPGQVARVLAGQHVECNGQQWRDQKRPRQPETAHVWRLDAVHRAEQHAQTDRDIPGCIAALQLSRNGDYVRPFVHRLVRNPAAERGCQRLRHEGYRAAEQASHNLRFAVFVV
jgi:hypothetical protein